MRGFLAAGLVRCKAGGLGKEGQGLCPWTKLGTGPQTPLILSVDKEGGSESLPTHT